MDRKGFLRKGLLVGGAILSAPLLARKVRLKESNYDKLLNNVGFTHQEAIQKINNDKPTNMNTVYHPANSRGHADHGWLNSHHTFSFANYHNPNRMNFGVLRVLNDDKVHAGGGFGTHPHDNMEIISIPLKGDLEHKDSMGNVAVIKEGDVQVMSAGTGIFHSEYNRNKDKEVEFLQIWVFPDKKNHSPRYDQISIANIKKKNDFYQILSPNQKDQGVWINQNAWFNMADFDKETTIDYTLNDKNNGVYFFVLEGEVSIESKDLNKRDGFGVWSKEKISLKAKANARILAMEVPMEL